MTISTHAELAYLTAQPVGRLATTGPAGPQIHPVWYRVNADTATIDIGGDNLRASRKYRNIRADPRVSFVVDDYAAEPAEPFSPGGQRGRGIEIRGRVDIVDLETPLFDGFGTETLRIHPRRMIAWNLDGPGYHARDIHQ